MTKRGLEQSMLNLRASTKTFEDADHLNPVETPAPNHRRRITQIPVDIATLDENQRSFGELLTGRQHATFDRQDRARVIFGSIGSGGYETTSQQDSARGLGGT